MDWFDPSSSDASTQAQKLNHALKLNGRILLRSASIEPWYIKNFEENGFAARRVGARFPGTCIDRCVYIFSFPAPVARRNNTNEEKQSQYVCLYLDLH